VIASLKGTLAERSLTDAVVDVHGVGYRVYLSVIALAQLPQAGQPVSLRIRTVVREDAFDLFGFLTKEEEELFLLLTSVSHVGPKVALTVMSGLDAAALAQAIAKGDVARLTKIHGVGKKTAERLVLELKDKVKELAPAAGGASSSRVAGAQGDLVSALVNLGYKDAQAEAAVRAASERAGAEASFEVLLREALKTLRSG
jgi:Holliday junction DNA helicase RuvA